MLQILSHSGGGYLGLYSAAVIAEIESTTKAPTARHFDLLAGTSIGGIIALALAHEVSAKDIQACFEEHGQKIFSARPAPQPGWPALYDVIRRSLFFSKYDPAPLRDIITEILGDLSTDTRRPFEIGVLVCGADVRQPVRVLRTIGHFNASLPCQNVGLRS